MLCWWYQNLFGVYFVCVFWGVRCFRVFCVFWFLGISLGVLLFLRALFSVFFVFFGVLFSCVFGRFFAVVFAGFFACCFGGIICELCGGFS